MGASADRIGSFRGETVDVFVSYAHADDEAPLGSDKGWVTTLVGELQKVLRRKLGGAGAEVWMDHQLAANQAVSEELLARVGGTRSLLLVLSPGYVKSVWCQRELSNYVAIASANRKAQSVFAIEIEPVHREIWPDTLRPLTPLKFWTRETDDIAPRLAGFPRPKPDEDSLYWKNVNELAHLIAGRLQDELTEGTSHNTTVLIAETTDDLDSARQSVASALAQRGNAVVLPATGYSRDSEVDFVSAVRSDLRNAQLFVQLLGPFIGKDAPGGNRSFVAIQAEEALHHRAALQIMQWCSPDLDLDRVVDPETRRLLKGEFVSRVGFEEFRRAVWQAVDRLAGDGPESAAPLIREVPPVMKGSGSLQAGMRNSAPHDTAPSSGDALAGGLSIYLQATPEDRATADEIADRLAGVGASVQLSPEPARNQTFLQCLMAQEEALRLCDGVLLVYGRSPVSAISAAFQYAVRVFGVRRPGVWSAVLDLPPADKQRIPIRSPNLTTIECRNGFELAKLGSFFEALRNQGNAASIDVQHG